jgi:hypothetical protein
MCLALAQKAINSQMTVAWDSWIARSEFSETGEMKDFALVRIYDNDLKTSGLEVEFDPLTVNLYVPDGKLGQVQVTLHLKSGKVFSEKTNLSRSETRKIDNDVEDMLSEAVKRGEISSADQNNDVVFDKYYTVYKKQNPEKFREETEIANWSISFLVDLDKKPCDLNVLQQIDPASHEAVSKCVQNSGLNDNDVFSIEYLFMKFTEVDLLLSDNKGIKIPDGVPQDVSVKARSCLNTMLQGNNGEFMLGTVVRRSKTRSEGHLIPTFGLTDFAFNVKADEHVPEASTLSYLGMFSKRPLPQGKDLDSARINLSDNWVRPEMLDGTKGSISGTMAISKTVFFDRYLILKVKEELGVDPQVSGLTWKFELNEVVEERISPDIVDRRYKCKSDAWLQVAIQPGTNELKITGRIDGFGDYDSYTWAPIEAMKIHEAWFHIAGHRDVEASIKLQGQGGSSDFKVVVDIVPDGDAMFKELVVDKNEVGGTAKLTDNCFSDNLAHFLGTTTINETLRKSQKSQYETFTRVVKERLSKIDMSLNNSAFIPPGGGVFTFQNLRFSNAGDLLFDVIYKAP